MKTELKSQFQLVNLRLLIRMTNCLQIYLKNCDFLGQNDVFLRFGVRPIWPKVRANQFGQNRPKVRPNRSVRSFTNIYLFFLECRRTDGLCWYQKVDFNLSRQNHISLKKENSKKKALLIRGNGYLNHSAADFHQWKM